MLISKAGNRLADAGLTEFDGEVRRTQVLIRFISLAAFYHSWCQAAWQEGFVALRDWAKTMEISPFRLAHLVGADFLEDLESLDDELFDDALGEMVDNEYSSVVSVLTRKGDNPLFVSLWLSRETRAGGENLMHRDFEVMNQDLTDEKFAGFEWIAGGCSLETGG